MDASGPRKLGINGSFTNVTFLCLQWLGNARKKRNTATIADVVPPNVVSTAIGDVPQALVVQAVDNREGARK